MPTNLENMQTRVTAIYVELAALSATKAGGKPNVSGSGDAVDHIGYKKSLYDELKSLNELIGSLEDPWEIIVS